MISATDVFSDYSSIYFILWPQNMDCNNQRPEHDSNIGDEMLTNSKRLKKFHKIQNEDKREQIIFKLKRCD